MNAFRMAAVPGEPTITLLHVSDTQFGAHHLFGGNGLTSADQHWDSLFARLHDDLDRLRADHGLRPDLLVASGDLAEWGMKLELERAETFLDQLSRHLGLPHRHVVIVPGNHDVNRKHCESYFLECEGNQEQTMAPYGRKWQPFIEMSNRFYQDEPDVTFPIDEPWTLFEMPELKVVVAGLNSTMAESHLDDDHYGWVGEAQLRWFAERLAHERDGWLRIGVVHHNLLRGAQEDDENLRDADDFHRILAPQLHLVLHGHTHNAKLGRLGSGLPVLSTGSAAVGKEARPSEVPNQYQVVQITAERITCWARRYELDQKRWVGDTRVSDNGSDWRCEIPEQFVNVHGTFPRTSRVTATDPGLEREAEIGRHGQDPKSDDFLARVEEVCRLRQPEATVTPVRSGERSYLRVTVLGRHYPVGACEKGVSSDGLERFITQIHATFQATDAHVRSELVYGGDRAPNDLIEAARRRGVTLMSFPEYQGILDLRRYLERQAERLESDRIYPPALYVSQRFTLLEGSDRNDDEDLLSAAIRWLGSPQGRFVVVLGDFGTGKTFLLHELARRLPTELPHLVPLLIEMRALEKSHTLNELVASHLAAQGEAFEPEAFDYMLREGRVALLFDGFDEMALRVTYDQAAEHLENLVTAAKGKAKVVVTSRTQHFWSDAQVTTALGDRVPLWTRRLARSEAFDESQVLAFLTNLCNGNEQRAADRWKVIRDIPDLSGLSHNPRMLSFIAGLKDEQLDQARQHHGEITAASLYREILASWLEQAHERMQGLLPLGQLWGAVTHVALTLWRTTEDTVGLAALGSAAATIEQMIEQKLDKAR